MKKVGKFIIVLSIVFTLGTYVTPGLFNDTIDTVEAATKRKIVKEGLQTYTVYPINKYFTPSEVKQIVKNYNKENNSSAIKIAKEIISVLHSPTGFILFARELSNDGLMKPFLTAKSKGKGVRIKYDYWVSMVSHSSYKIKNKTITVQ